MAVVVSAETNVALTAGTAVDVASARVGRKGLSFQVQAPGGYVWVNFSGTAAVGTGFRIGPYETVEIVGKFGAGDIGSSNYYEGAVSILWEGWANVDGPVTSANARVIEIS